MITTRTIRQRRILVMAAALKIYTTTVVYTAKHNEAQDLELIIFAQCELLPHLKTEHRNCILPIVQMWGGRSKEWERGRESESERHYMCIYPCTCSHSLHGFRATPLFECVGGLVSVLPLPFFSGYINIQHLNPHWEFFNTRSKNNSF